MYKYSLFSLNCAVIVISFLLGGWVLFLRDSASCRSATHMDSIEDRYAGLTLESKDVRNFLVVDCYFVQATALSAQLIRSENGQLTEISSVVACKEGILPSRGQFKLAFEYRQTAEGTCVKIGAAGVEQGGHSGGYSLVKIDPASRYLFSGRISPHTDRIVYFEGAPGVDLNLVQNLDDLKYVDSPEFYFVIVRMH